MNIEIMLAMLDDINHLLDGADASSTVTPVAVGNLILAMGKLADITRALAKQYGMPRHDNSWQNRPDAA